jgi:hypothetical protein
MSYHCSYIYLYQKEANICKHDDYDLEDYLPILSRDIKNPEFSEKFEQACLVNKSMD